MSRAFVKESEGAELDELPELAVSPHRNLVTPTGLRQIEETLVRLEAELAEARAAQDRLSVARIERDLRYWRQRRGSAEVVSAGTDAGDVVRFGSQVTLETESRERLAFRIVGEDEADPKRGLISYVSPIAARLIGCRIGDLVEIQGREVEVVRIQ
jgi:transcription elongation GreA/GreB family factor